MLIAQKMCQTDFLLFNFIATYYQTFHNMYINICQICTIINILYGLPYNFHNRNNAKCKFRALHAKSEG